MQRTFVSAIIQDKNGRFLLQERDDEPNVGKRCLFGGKLEEGENREETCRREIKEELNYIIKNLEFFKSYPIPGVDREIFVVKDPVVLEELELHEGSDLKFFSADELDDIEFAFGMDEILAHYIKGKSFYKKSS